MKTVHYNVSGLTGLDSKSKVINGLDKIKGVQEVAVDLSRLTVEVEYNEPANEEKIRACIEKIGFDVQ